MPALTIFLSTGLLCYWISRTLLIMRGSEEEINRVLADDLRRFDQVLAGIPPNLVAG